MIRKSIFTLAPLAVACLLATDALGAQRAFVRSNGADSGICTLTVPCRTFAYAMTQVDPSGEIIALDAAGYGPVAITKSVTITANQGFFAGIAAASGSAISIIAPGLNVVLRSLALNGVGATTGIAMQDAGKLTVENCVISGFTGDGIAVTSPATVRIVDTIVRGNGTEGNGDGIFIGSGSNASLNNVKMSRNQRAGLAVSDTTSEPSTVSVMNSDSSFNNYGYLAQRTGMASARLAILRSSASGNGIGAVGVVGTNAHAAVSFSHLSGNPGVAYFNPFSEGVIESYNNNVVRHNGGLSNGTVTPAMGQ